MNLFEQASRKRLRFDSDRGLMTVEDLWTIPLQSKNGFSLDAIAIELSKKVSEQEVSFVSKRSPAHEDDLLRFEIVKYIIESRLAEAEAKKVAGERKAELETLQALLAKKKMENLEQMSVEEIEAKLASLTKESPSV